MASHKINITIANAAAGIPPDKTGIMGMVLRGPALSGLALDTPYILTSMEDATAIGVTAAYDATNNTAVYQQINEFYDQAGPGALLWIQITAIANAFAAYVASVHFSNFVRYTAQADPTMQAKVIGLCYDVPQTVQTAADFPADVTATITAFQTVQQQLFQMGYPFSGIVDGYNMSSTVTPASIGTMATNTAFAISLCITGTKGNGVSAVGLALGKLARISVGRGMGAVADGAIDTTSAYLTNGIALYPGGTALTVGNSYTVVGGTILYNAVTYTTGQQFVAIMGHTAFTTVDTGYVLYNSTSIAGDNSNTTDPIIGMDPTDLELLGDKQFLFITTVQGISGLYWNDGATCVATTQLLSSQEYNRVANSLSYDARAFFTLLRGLNLPTDVQTGALDPVFCATKAKSFYTTFIKPLTAAAGSGDITDGSMLITGPTYGADAQLNFTITLVRSTILGDVVGTIGFSLTL